MCGFFVPEDIKNFGITENIYLFSTHPVMGALRTAYILNGISFAYTTEADVSSDLINIKKNSTNIAKNHPD